MIPYERMNAMKTVPANKTVYWRELHDFEK